MGGEGADEVAGTLTLRTLRKITAKSYIMIFWYISHPIRGRQTETDKRKDRYTTEMDRGTVLRAGATAWGHWRLEEEKGEAMGREERGRRKKRGKSWEGKRVGGGGGRWMGKRCGE